MKTIKVLFLAALIVMGSVGSAPGQVSADAFLSTAVACNASTTLVHGTGFTSAAIAVKPNRTGSITVTFTRAAGSATLTVDFEFTVSYNNGSTFSTASFATISVETGALAASNVVRATALVNLSGVTHIRLNRIVNNDTVNNLTACNATLSME